MKVIIVKDYEEGARRAADVIEGIVREKPACTLGLATGSSPTKGSSMITSLGSWISAEMIASFCFMPWE